MPSRSPLYLSAPTLRSCLTDSEVYEVIGETLRELTTGRVINGPKSGFGVDIDGNHLHMGSVSGYVLSNSVTGIKWFTVSERNPSLNLPRVPATILVCDAETGLLDGVLDGTQLTSERTAAMAVAAANVVLSVALCIAGVAIGRAAVGLFVK